MPASYQFRLQNTVDWMKTAMETSDTRFHGFKDYEVQRLQRVVDQMDPKQNKFSQQVKADFYRFFNEHDKRRGTDFLQTFPEMSEWWDECKYWSENDRQ
jgi:hypothetical protein